MNARLKQLTPGLAIVTTMCIAAAPANAADETTASRQENVGVLAGLVIGAAAAGPFGAIVGAATGAWLGDRYHRQSAANADLARELHRNRDATATLSSTLVELQTHNDELARVLEERRELETQVLFRTGEATLAPEWHEQVKKLGGLLSTMPDTKVQVSGYADARGTEELNSTLSQQRADAVAAVLESSGVDRARLDVDARGESGASSLEGDVDGYALDRKVVIRLAPIDSEQVAQQTE